MDVTKPPILYEAIAILLWYLINYQLCDKRFMVLNYVMFQFEGKNFVVCFSNYEFHE